MFFGYAIIAFFKSSKGWLGEKAVASALKKLDKVNYLVLNVVLLKTDRGTSQIDHLVFSI